MGPDPSPAPKRLATCEPNRITVHGMRPMNTDDLSTAFCQTKQKLEQELVYTHCLGEVAGSNSVILAQFVARVRRLEQVTAVTTIKTDQMDKYLLESSKETKRLRSRTDQIDHYFGGNRRQTKTAFQQIAGLDKAHNRKLRNELIDMSAEIKKGFGELASSLA